MDQNTFNLLLQQGSITVILPLIVNWLKKKLPTLVDATPIQNLLVAWLLLTGFTWLGCWGQGLSCTWASVQQLVLASAPWLQLSTTVLKTNQDSVALGLNKIKDALPTISFTKPETPPTA